LLFLSARNSLLAIFFSLARFSLLDALVLGPLLRRGLSVRLGKELLALAGRLCSLVFDGGGEDFYTCLLFAWLLLAWFHSLKACFPVFAF